MTRPWRIALALVVALLACEDSAGPSGQAGGLVLHIIPSPSGSVALDSGYVRVTGPTNATVKVVPGTTVTIDALQPGTGTYTVVLEGFIGLALVRYVKISGVTVQAGQNTTVPVPLSTFALVQLSFTGQPTNVPLGRAMSPGVRVSVRDGNTGDVITTARNSVTLSLGTNPSAGSLTTPQTVTAVDGFATFSNVAIDEAGSGYTLVAASNPLVDVTSAGFNVTNKALVTHTESPGMVSVIETATNTKVGSPIVVGDSPYEDVAFTADGAFAYVPNAFSNDVSVINMATSTIAVTVPAGAYPRAVAIGVTPNGPRAYVANSNSNNVTVINTTTNSVTTTITVGFTPARVALTPDGSKALVTNFNSNSVSVIATGTNTVTGTIPVGPGPQGIAVTPNGTAAYVANSQGDSVSVINLSNNTVTARILVGNFPVGVDVTPDGQFVYVANQLAGTVSVIATSTNTVVATITLGGATRNLRITPGGGFVYVPNSAQSVFVIRTASNSVVDTIAVGPQGSAIGLGITPKP